jgi:hypothetical protein
MFDTLYGFRVIVASDVPKLQLGEPVKQYLTPEQIADHNAWMRDFFGTTNRLRDGEVVTSHASRSFHMNPRTYQQLTQAVANG